MKAHEANRFQRGGIEARGSGGGHARTDDRGFDRALLINDEAQDDLHFNGRRARRKRNDHRRFRLSYRQLRASYARDECVHEHPRAAQIAKNTPRHSNTNWPSSASSPGSSEVNGYSPSTAGVSNVTVARSPGSSAGTFAVSGKHDI